MLCSEDMRGMEVLNFQSKRIGIVLFPYWKCKNNHIDGLVLIKNNFMQIKFYVPYSSVDRVEGNCIYLIRNYGSRKKELTPEPIKAKLKDRTVYISKYFFDEENGRVKSVEIAKSIYEDVIDKRKHYDDFRIDNGTVIIE